MVCTGTSLVSLKLYRQFFLADCHTCMKSTSLCLCLAGFKWPTSKGRQGEKTEGGGKGMGGANRRR